MPNITPWTPEQLDAFRYSSNGDDARWLATLGERETRLRRAVEACKRVSSPCEEPSVCLTGDYRKGLMCGVEDRDFQARGYDAAEYGFNDGVDRALEWVRGELFPVLADNADLLKGESP